MTTIKQKLDAMPMEDFEVLLKRVAGNKSQEAIPEHAELLNELERQGKVQPDEPIPTLTSAKYSSSLQSLNQKSNNCHLPPPVYSVNSTSSGHTNHHYHHHQNYQNYHPNHTSTLTTINSNSSLNSVGVDPAVVSTQGDDLKRQHTSISPTNKYPCDDPPHLPYSYFFNEREPEIPNGYRGSRQSSSADRFRTHLSTLDTLDVNSQGANNSTGQLPKDYPNEGAVSARGPLVGSVMSSNAGELTRCLTPNFPSQNQPMIITKSPSEGSNADKMTRKGPGDRPIKKKANKSVSGTLIDIEKLPGFRGTDDIENLVQFVEGTYSTSVSKRNNKKRDPRTKDKETLVKSASLDENHLNYNTKRSGEVVEIGSERKRSNEERDEKKKESPTPYNTSLAISRLAPRISRSVSQNLREEKMSKDESPEEPFELVQSKKRRSKRSSTQREAYTFSRGKGAEQSRREQTRGRRNPGDRRKSVGSVPGSENSEGSDDDSVRSLPAGECTPKERVPKQCASSGGTPQTSYADIARMTDTNKVTPSNTQIASISVSREPQSDIEMLTNNDLTAVPPVKTKAPKAPSTDSQEKEIKSRVKAPEVATNVRPQETDGGVKFSKPSSQPKPQRGDNLNKSENRPSCVKYMEGGEENKYSPPVVAVNGEGSNVPIEDKTEFPEIHTSFSRVPVPFSERKKLNTTTDLTTKCDGRDSRDPSKFLTNCKSGARKKMSSNQNSNPSDQVHTKPAKTILNQSPVGAKLNGSWSSNETLVLKRNEPSSLISLSPPDVPVVFCGGNFEQEVPPSHDVGFEFGFDVMRAMSQFSEEMSCTGSEPPPKNSHVEKGVVDVPAPGESRTIDIRVPESDGHEVKEKVRGPQPRESLLGSYCESSQSFDNRRGSQFAHPRLPRLPPHSFRGQQRNGGMFIGQQQAQSPYGVQLSPSGTRCTVPPQTMVHQPIFCAPQMASPHHGFSHAFVPGSPFGHSPTMPRGIVSMGQSPFILPPVMYNIPGPLSSDEGALSPPSFPSSVNHPLSRLESNVCGQVYIAPSCPVPMRTHEVENWMNLQVERTYNLGHVHRIEDLN